MGKQVEVPEYEIQDRVTVDAERTALLIIDMQHDFVDADGALPVPGAKGTVPVIRRLIDFARTNRIPTFYSQDTHRDGDPEWEIWGKHCERGSRGWEIVEELAPRPDDLVFEKARYDAFYGTSLDHELRRRGIDTLIICGTVASICVHYTAASAGLRWFRTIHPLDALSALNPFDLEAALRQSSFLFRTVLTTADAIGAGRGTSGEETHEPAPSG